MSDISDDCGTLRENLWEQEIDVTEVECSKSIDVPNEGALQQLKRCVISVKEKGR